MTDCRTFLATSLDKPYLSVISLGLLTCYRLDCLKRGMVSFEGSHSTRDGKLVVFAFD